MTRIRKIQGDYFPARLICTSTHLTIMPVALSTALGRVWRKIFQLAEMTQINSLASLESPESREQNKQRHPRAKCISPRQICHLNRLLRLSRPLRLSRLSGLSQRGDDLLVGFRKGIVVKLIQGNPANRLAGARLRTASRVAAVEGVQRDAKMRVSVRHDGKGLCDFDIKIGLF